MLHYLLVYLEEIHAALDEESSLYNLFTFQKAFEKFNYKRLEKKWSQGVKV